jgi:hypothetical protein
VPSVEKTCSFAPLLSDRRRAATSPDRPIKVL